MGPLLRERLKRLAREGRDKLTGHHDRPNAAGASALPAFLSSYRRSNLHGRVQQPLLVTPSNHLVSSFHWKLHGETWCFWQQVRPSLVMWWSSLSRTSKGKMLEALTVQPACSRCLSKGSALGFCMEIDDSWPHWALFSLHCQSAATRQPCHRQKRPNGRRGARHATS